MALEIKRIDDRVSVAGQIGPDEMEAVGAAGFTTVVNNRPDGEAPDQPTGAEIGRAAEAAGLRYLEIPVGREGMTPQMIEQARAVEEESEGPVLMFCRSGTRSTTLWALSQAGRREAGEIIALAAGAGYDISHLAGHLDKPLG